ncbi:MepB family protein [Peribacillus sp. NPDC096622]|uniref:MepB family protein n=1 Tax=Peribacillus sp. NPDC096622 TaxID=3364396 RepID=UPI00381C58CC
MNNFFTALTYVNKMIYESNHLTVKSVQEEKQNSKYGAGTFQLSSKTVRFRVANITPTKVGQFVAFWEKDQNNKNQPYLYEEAPDISYNYL